VRGRPTPRFRTSAVNRALGHRLLVGVPGGADARRQGRKSPCSALGGATSSRLSAARRSPGRSRHGRSRRGSYRLGNHRVGYTCDPEPLVRRLLSSGCANSVGSMVALLRSSIAGRKDATSASPRSRPSSSSAKLMSLLHHRLSGSWLPSRRRQSSPSFSWQGTQSAPAWSQVSRDQAAMLPDSRSSRPRLMASDSIAVAYP
jgi:hypothetical protein